MPPKKEKTKSSILTPKIDIIGKEKGVFKFTLSNTSQFNNQIIMQRLGCIPIHIDDITKNVENLQITIDVKNDSDSLLFITTKDIIIQQLMDVAGNKDRIIAEDLGIIPQEVLDLRLKFNLRNWLVFRVRN